jgi:Family of unknown function (DUF6527)
VRRTSIDHKFVEFVPPELEAGKLYISIPYATAVHLCACGCGNKVVTPISPAEWRLLWDGDTVSLSPSIGNWQFPCRSHYWLRRGRINWSRTWSEREIAEGRALDAEDIESYFASRSRAPTGSYEHAEAARVGLLRRLFETIRRRVS